MQQQDFSHIKRNMKWQRDLEFLFDNTEGLQDANVELQRRENRHDDCMTRRFSDTLAQGNTKLKMQYLLIRANSLICRSWIYSSVTTQKVIDQWKPNLKIDFEILSFVKLNLYCSVCHITLTLMNQWMKVNILNLQNPVWSSAKRTIY
jgi:hypothetical protein